MLLGKDRVVSVGARVGQFGLAWTGLFRVEQGIGMLLLGKDRAVRVEQG